MVWMISSDDVDDMDDFTFWQVISNLTTWKTKEKMEKTYMSRWLSIVMLAYQKVPSGKLT